MWGGKLRRVPENFKFPSTGVRETWREWWLGNHELGYPALRNLDSVDMGDASNKNGKNKRRRLCDLQKLMKRMESVRTDFRRPLTYFQALVATSDLTLQPTPMQVDQMYEKAYPALKIPTTTPKNRRRPRPITWRTVVREVLDKETTK